MDSEDNTPADVIILRHDGSRELHWNAAPRWVAEEQAECLDAVIGASAVAMTTKPDPAMLPPMRYVVVDHDHEHEWGFSEDGSEVCAICGVWRVPERPDPFIALWSKAARTVAALKEAHHG